MRRLMMLGMAVMATGASAQFAPSLRPTRVPEANPAAPTWREARDIRDRVDRGRESGQLSRKEARRYKRAAGGLGAAASSYARDGLTDDEERELATRAQVLRAHVFEARSRGQVAPR